ncbi:HlyD family efflux transporter periplasmic adaptor subunit [Oerskovia merdavium]|uniref:HlyD family efflux transporter periplasmic adaptor subunit n=1 Tax=Oerskovia merdavium TaxID=2762227 RepID=A0ABR8TV55_9CELL|nr:HlyD family efflux transporter periplasmic adaptor subunit [Oerskovia merdavium]MBD7979666.1 HlyD family efflux transporter periplasmic adaptor subunit [Oerskovia merdavium]
MTDQDTTAATSATATAGEPVRTPASVRRAARRRRKLVVSGVSAVVVVSLVGAGAAFAANRGSEGTYRTATATTGEVTQTVDAAGTVASAARADAAFSVAGTVATVAVGVGDTVSAGDVLATLDLTELEDAVESAQETLARAEQTLEDDLASQTSSSSTSATSTGATASSGAAASTTPSSSASTSTGTPGVTQAVARTSGASTVTQVVATTTPSATSPSAGSTSTSAEVAQALEAVELAQQALLDGYDAATAALETSSTSVVGSQEACAAFLAATAEDLASAAADPEDDAPDGVDLAAALTTCQDAITATLGAQSDVDGAQHSLLELAAQLDAAIQKAQDALAADQSGGSGEQTPGGSGSGTGDGSGGTAGTPSGPSGSDGSAGGSSGAGGATGPSGTGSSGTGSTTGPTTGGSSTGGSKVASAQQVLADRAAIDLAEAQVAIAQADAQRSTLTSPIAGTVAQVALAVGDEVEASSTSAVVTVLGVDGYVVETTVPLTAVASLAVGQETVVTVSDDPTVRTGTVSSIGVLSTSTSSTPEYPVTIALDPQDDTLYEGSSAQASITVAGGTDVLVVPTSAVRATGTARTVAVLRDGKVTDVTVEVGAVGQETTEITSGLEAGDEVVLADLSQEIVTDEETSTGLSGLGDSGTTQQRGQMPSGGGGQFPAGGTGGPPSRG